MAFDYTKEYKEFYLPKNEPTIIEIPKMNYLAVKGQGNPNEENGEYQKALELLYSIAYTLKMSYKTSYKITDFFEYKVPPLEGFWWQEGIKGVDCTHKETFNWISVIRLPDFVTKKDFDWAIAEATKKKGIDYSKVEYYEYDEGLVVQCLHKGPYDDEPVTVELMDTYATKEGYELDINNQRMHHEIYLGDPRKSRPENLRTVIRHPIK